MSVGDVLIKEFPSFFLYLEQKRSNKDTLFAQSCTKGYELVNDYCQKNQNVSLDTSHKDILSILNLKLEDSNRWKLIPENYSEELGFVVGAFVAFIDNYQYHVLENEALFNTIKRIIIACKSINVFDLDLFHSRIKNLSRNDRIEVALKRRKVLLELSSQKWSVNYWMHRLRV